MDVAVPCRYTPAYGQSMFDPGFLFRSRAGEELARVGLSASSRYTGFWKFLGTSYTHTRFDLILTVGGEHVLTLEARAKNAGTPPENLVRTPTGEPAGQIDITRGGFAFKKWAKIVYRDQHDKTVGTIAWSASPGSQVLKLCDSRYDDEYEMVNRAGDPLKWVIESQRADVIDARILLAWCFYSHFWNVGDD